MSGGTASPASSSRRGTATQAGGTADAGAAPAARAAAGAGKAAGKQRLRLDDFCHAQHPEHSKNVIQSWILQGKVLVDDKVVSKAGTPVKPGQRVVINAEQPKYVCR